MLHRRILQFLIYAISQTPLFRYISIVLLQNNYITRNTAGKASLKRPLVYRFRFTPTIDIEPQFYLISCAPERIICSTEQDEYSDENWKVNVLTELISIFKLINPDALENPVS